MSTLMYFHSSQSKAPKFKQHTVQRLKHVPATVLIIISPGGCGAEAPILLTGDRAAKNIGKVIGPVITLFLTILSTMLMDTNMYNG